MATLINNPDKWELLTKRLEWSAEKCQEHERLLEISMVLNRGAECVSTYARSDGVWWQLDYEGATAKVLALLPGEEPDTVERTDRRMFHETWPDSWITPRSVTKAPKKPIEAGALILGNYRDEKSWTMLLVREIDAEGIPLLCADGAGELRHTPKSYFQPMERDGAMELMWGQGGAQWQSYIACIGALARVQKKLDKTANKKPRVSK